MTLETIQLFQNLFPLPKLTNISVCIFSGEDWGSVRRKLEIYADKCARGLIGWAEISNSESLCERLEPSPVFACFD